MSGRIRAIALVTLSLAIAVCTNFQSFASTLFPGNGHFYQYFNRTSGMTWHDCKAAAENLGGHLATISDQAENDFILSLAPPASHTFIGGTDEGHEGIWMWVTGETFWQNGSCLQPFCKWDTNEPSNSGGVEHFLDIVTDGTHKGGWNDGLANPTNVPSYIVEWERKADFGASHCFNGTDHWIGVPNSASLNVSTALTIEAWIKLADLPSTDVAEYAIVSKWAGTGSAGGRYLFGIASGANSGKLLLNVQGGGAFSNTALVPNVWYHVATTFDGTMVNMYINGLLDKSTSVTSGFGFSSTQLAIGKNIHNFSDPNVKPYYFKGEIDEVRISNKVRIPQEFSLSAPGAPDANTMALWHMDAPSSITDASSNGNSGTANGSGCGAVDPCIANRLPFVDLGLTATIESDGTNQICIPVTFSDPDGNIMNIALNLGYYDLNTGQICLGQLSPGSYIVMASVTDSCNATDKDTLIITVVEPATQSHEIVIGLITIRGDLIQDDDDGNKDISGNVTINDFLKFSGDVHVDLERLTATTNGRIFIEYLNQQLTLFEGECEFGILGQSGELTEFLNGNILNQLQVAGLKVTLRDLSLLPDGVMIAGRIDLLLPLMDKHKPVVISITNLSVSQSSGVQVTGQVNVPTVDLLGFRMENTQLNFDTPNDVFSGYTMVKTPLVGIGGGATIREGKLDRVKLTIQLGNPIPIGATGCFLAGGTGELNHLSSPSIIITVTVDITAGPQIGSVYLAELKDFGLTIAPPDMLKGMGKLKLFGQNVASSEIQYQAGVIGAKGNINLVDVLNAQLVASLRGDAFEGSADGSLTIPDGEGWIYDLIRTAADLPYELASAGAVITNDRFEGDFKIEKEFQVVGQTIRLNLQFAYKLAYEPPQVAFYLGTNKSDLQRVLLLNRPYVASTNITSMNSATFLPLDSFFVPLSDGQLVVGARSDGNATTFALRSPSGIIYSLEDSVRALSNRVFFLSRPGNGSRFCVVDNPEPGFWLVSDPDGSQQADEMTAFILKAPNAISMGAIQPQGVNQALIQWRNFASDADALISLYYDKDNSGGDGAPIASNISINGSTQQHSWNTSRIPTGTYYVYAKLVGSIGTPALSYSPNRVTVLNADAPLPPSDLHGAALEDSVELIWTRSNSASASAYTLHYSDGRIQSELTVGDATRWIVTGLKAGRTFKFHVTAYDTLGNVSTPSNEITLTLASTTGQNYPEIKSNPIMWQKMGREYTYQVVASDRDGNHLMYNLTDAPIGMVCDDNGEVSWASDNIVPGRFPVGIVVDDGTQRADTQSFVLTVYPESSGRGECWLNKKYVFGEKVATLVTVKDYDLNNDPDRAENATIHVKSESAPAGFDLQCLETAASSGLFTGVLFLDDEQSQSDESILAVSDADTVLVEYYDSDPVQTDNDYCVWYKHTYGSLEGLVGDSKEGLLGVEVQLYREDGSLWKSFVTINDGRYKVDSLPNGRYSIEIVTPLGFQADQEIKEFTIYFLPTIVNFNVTKVDITPRQRSRAYWASQLSKALCVKPQDFTKVQFSKFAGLIAQHFNGNAINPVENYVVPQPAAQTDSLKVLGKLLNFQCIDPNEPFLKRIARGELLALMLNVVSGKVSQTQVVTKDGMTLSQAITYCDLLVNDIPVTIGEVPETYMPDCHRSEELKRYIKASFIAGLINVGVTLPAGSIPSDVVNIAYKYAGETPPIPIEFALNQNYPNPFNPVTNFEFALPAATNVKFEIYNTLGQRVAILVDGRMEAGSHVVSWDASSHASGVYLYRLTAGDFVETKKMVLLK